jgi:hypothetical protein
MKTIRSSHIASAAVVALLALPAAALAQLTQSPAAGYPAGSRILADDIAARSGQEHG